MAATHPVCLYGHSALEFWRSARSAPGADDYTRDTAGLSASPATADALPRLAALPAALRQPVEVLVTGTGARYSPEGFAVHHRSGGLPAESLVNVGKHVIVASPELCFLQMARVLSIHELIQLGFELCGTYAPPTPGTEALRQRSAPLTCVERLGRLIGQMAGTPGHKRAVRALGYVLENARSPMEAVVAMLLCLPRKLGGKGLPPATLNPRIELDATGRKLARRSYLVGDLYWEEARLDVEYEGRAFHTGERSMASDKNRANALNHMGIDVVSLFDEHVRDDDMMNAVVTDLARHLSVRIRPYTPNDVSKTRELRRAVLAHPGSAQPAWPGLRAENPLLDSEAWGV